MKKFLLVFTLILSLCLSLAGCGEAPGEAGKYNCTGYSYKGLRIFDSSFSQSGSSITLGKHGRGSFSHEGVSGEISWFSGGEYLEIKIGDKSYEGSIKNGVIELGITDELHVFFDWDQLPQNEQENSSQSFYGIFSISDSQGSMPETWTDCCARIDFVNSQPELRIFDEDGSFENPMAQAYLDVKDGVFYTLGGSFWYDELKEGQWVLDFKGGDYPQSLCLEGKSLDKDGAEFGYTIFLRPWGVLWDDMIEINPKYRPYHYEDFYLPLIEDNKPMPDKIESVK